MNILVEIECQTQEGIYKDTDGGEQRACDMLY